LVDNVKLLDEETIKQISDVVVRGSHGIIKKKEVVDCLNLAIKVDSFAVEKDVHFPTDMNLLWDSGRKCLAIIDLLRKEHFTLPAWRQLNGWYKKLRRAYRICSEIHRKKGAKYEERLLLAAEEYLKISGQISVKVGKLEREGALHIMTGNGTKAEFKLLKELTVYKKMLDKHRDLMHRRIILGEKIPHSEKVFSIFEPETEWLSKGKANNKVELGHNVQVATDQYHFIVYHEVCIQEVDKERTIAIGKGIKDKFKGLNYGFESISFDRNYYSLPAKTSLEKEYKLVVLPKPGKKSQAQQSLEQSDDFVKMQKKHSTIEANISQLEHHGLGKCRDKGVEGFKRYVAYGVLAYNLHRMGNLLLQEEREKGTEQRAKKFTSLQQVRQAFRATG
jgi:IS5 family transposase